MTEGQLHPKFRTEKDGRNVVHVYVQCAKCDKDIRELKPKESISVTIAHLCDECSQGGKIIIPNFPNKE